MLVNVTLVGLRLHVRPADGDTVADRATVPANPLSPLAVIVDVELPPVEVTDVGFAPRLKSST